MPDLTWRKSTGTSLEIAWLDNRRVLIRNSRNPGPAIVASREDWQAFVASVKADRFDPDA
jgi:hypothetical protein